MTTIQLCMFVVSMLLAFLAGIICGIIRFGGDPPVGCLKIRYGDPEEPPDIFLELWDEAGNVAKHDTVNLVVSEIYRTVEDYIARK